VLSTIGSVRVITDQAGGIIQRFDYTPFGNEWNSVTAAETRRFTGHERDSESGLEYFGARHYSGQLFRFMSVDPLLAADTAVTDPQRWNRYSYVGNRPLSTVDPDGRGWLSTAFAIGKALYKGQDVYATMSGITDAVQTIASLDARVGETERLLAVGSLVAEVSGASDLLKGGRVVLSAAEDIGRHAGMIRNYANRSLKELQKAARSYEKRIEDHIDWIADPTKKVKDFHKLDPRRQDDLVNNKWPDDIKRLREQLAIIKRLIDKVE
jgi:RHS repeat-associated protein